MGYCGQYLPNWAQGESKSGGFDEQPFSKLNNSKANIPFMVYSFFNGVID
jgi:hypothetical protein